MAKKSQWKMIAGRGAIGSVNWGYDDSIPLSTYEKWHEELKKHYGEMVAITGGGGFGTQFGRLLSSEIVADGPWRSQDGSKHPALQARIQDVYDPTKSWSEPRDFDPWVNSWQIWVGGKAPYFHYKPFKFETGKTEKWMPAKRVRKKRASSQSSIGTSR